MSTECKDSVVNRVEVGRIERLWSGWWWRFWVVVGVVAVASMVTVALINSSLTAIEQDAQFASDVSSTDGSTAATTRDAGFDCLDHELRVAGGYGLALNRASASRLTIADGSDRVQGAVMEAEEAALGERSMAAYAARYQGMADRYVAGEGLCACIPLHAWTNRGA